MAEITRVNTAIDAFFDASGEEDVTGLVDALERSLMTTEAHSHGNEIDKGRRYLKDFENKELMETVEKIKEDLKALAAELPKDRDDKKRAFYDITFRTMAAKRASYPLEHPECPSIIMTPEEALLDDDDMYSFSIFDDQAESIQELAPALYQLACEGDDYDSEEEEESVGS